MVMDLVIWPATLVPVVFPTRLFRRELFPLGIFQSGTTLGFKRVPRVKAVECGVREWVYEAKHLLSPNDAKLMLVRCQPGTIVAVREWFGGIAAVPGGGEQAVVLQWDMPPVDTPIVHPNTLLTCGWLAQSLR